MFVNILNPHYNSENFQCHATRDAYKWGRLTHLDYCFWSFPVNFKDKSKETRFLENLQYSSEQWEYLRTENILSIRSKPFYIKRRTEKLVSELQKMIKQKHHEKFVDPAESESQSFQTLESHLSKLSDF